MFTLVYWHMVQYTFAKNVGVVVLHYVFGRM